MEKERITLNEVQNDGRTVHLYWNGAVGLWTAYGISAFLLRQVVRTRESYSEELQMPVVLADAVRTSGRAVAFTPVTRGDDYLCMRATRPMCNEAEYAAWAALRREGGAATSGKWYKNYEQN